jgi:hypothetical protein
MVCMFLLFNQLIQVSGKIFISYSNNAVLERDKFLAVICPELLGGGASVASCIIQICAIKCVKVCM